MVLRARTKLSEANFAPPRRELYRLDCGRGILMGKMPAICRHQLELRMTSRVRFRGRSIQLLQNAKASNK